MESCPCPDDILAFLGDRLDSNTDFIVEHLETCPHCQAMLERLTAQAATSWLPWPKDSRTPRQDQVPTGTAIHVPGFEIFEELGRGGYGVVYRARHLKLGRLVALKLLRYGSLATPTERKRFAAEARAVAKLDNENIIRVYGVEEQDGATVAVLELAEGGSLARRLNGTPLAGALAARLTAMLARGAHFAHEHGIVHRDLKPANVLLADASLDRPKITDFGQAKGADEGGAPTPTAEVLGTPSYMAPEQAFGHSRDAGPAVDIYALGAILYEMLTGRAPFKGETPYETLLQVRQDEPVPPRQLVSKVPHDLEIICLKCLRKETARRYSTAAALADDLERFLAGQPIQARVPRLWERAVAWGRHRPRLTAGLVVGVVVAVAGAAGLQWSASQVRAAQTETKAQASVETITASEVTRVPFLVEQFGDLRPLVLPRLRRLVDTAPPASRERINAALALAEDDADQADFLVEWALKALPEDLIVIRKQLRTRADGYVPGLWQKLADQDTESGVRLRAACLLAEWAAADERWTATAGQVTNLLLAENALLMGRWAESLKPVRRHLVPHLAAVCRAPTHPEVMRTAAAVLLVDYVPEESELLARLLIEADGATFRHLVAALRPGDSKALTVLEDAFQKKLPKPATETRKDEEAARTARAAIGLLYLGKEGPAWALLGLDGPDQRKRTALIHALAEAGVAASRLMERFRTVFDHQSKRAVILALGDYEPAALQKVLGAQGVADLLAVYQSDADAGLHAAVGWLLRRRLDRASDVARLDEGSRGKPAESRRWWVSPRGMPMAQLGPAGQFNIGTQHQPGMFSLTEFWYPCHVPYTFALATREVTVREFREFLQAHPKCGYLPPDGPLQQEDEPILNVTWFQAVQFCRWLGEKEGVLEDQQCYPPDAEIKRGVQFYQGFLRRTGYRLPTEMEWEYACRAGTDTPRAFGNAPALLGHYAWYLANSEGLPGPVAHKLPNDFGLFDTYGNAWEWTQPMQRISLAGDGKVYECWLDDPKPTVSDVASPYHPVARGGSFLYHSLFVRSAKRYPIPPDKLDGTVGFRVARTLPTKSSREEKKPAASRDERP